MEEGQQVPTSMPNEHERALLDSIVIIRGDSCSCIWVVCCLGFGSRRRGIVRVTGIPSQVVRRVPVCRCRGNELFRARVGLRSPAPSVIYGSIIVGTDVDWFVGCDCHAIGIYQIEQQ